MRSFLLQIGAMIKEAGHYSCTGIPQQFGHLCTFEKIAWSWDLDLSTLFKCRPVANVDEEGIRSLLSSRLEDKPYD